MKKRPLALALSLLVGCALPALAQIQVELTGVDHTGKASTTNPVPTYDCDSPKATYSATITYFTPYATPTDIVGIVGSATKTVKLRKVFLSSTQTAAGVNNWFVIKRALADTGGSPATATRVPLDSANAAATAVVQKYTAAPTINSTVGTVRIASLLSPAPASVMSGDNLLVDDLPDAEPFTLRGVAEELDLNFGGAAVPGGLSMSITVVWTEE